MIRRAMLPEEAMRCQAANRRRDKGFCGMPGVGIEPTWVYTPGILSPFFCSFPSILYATVYIV